jgi:hypothetical protein
MPENMPEKYAMKGVIPEWKAASVPKDKIALQTLRCMTCMVQCFARKIKPRRIFRTGGYRPEGLAITTPYLEDPIASGDRRDIMGDPPP